jgi:hypothetical protein
MHTFTMALTQAGHGRKKTSRLLGPDKMETEQGMDLCPTSALEMPRKEMGHKTEKSWEDPRLSGMEGAGQIMVGAADRAAGGQW